MNSIFTPLMREGLTSFKIRYDFKSDQLRLEAMKEWEADIDFSQYNKSFYSDDILTDNILYLNTYQVRDLFRKYGLLEYLNQIIDLVRAGKHFGIECYYDAKNDIKIMCHQHSRKIGNNNRSHALFLDGIRRCEPEEEELSIITDGLNLSRGMSFKNIAAGLDFGGSKTMVQCRPLDLNDKEVMGFIGFAFDKCKCFTGADLKVPTAIADVQKENGFSTNFVCGPKSILGETGKPTAYGVYKTLKKAVLFKEGTESLDGKSVVLMGLGSVGWSMGMHLLSEDVKLYVTDLNQNRIQEFIEANPGRDVQAVDAEDALYMDVDIISPCAIGNLIREDNVDKLKCKYIWGSANNQIQAGFIGKEIEIAELLAEKDILFQPEWWYNTGGVLCGAHEYLEGKNASYEKLIAGMDAVLPDKTWDNLTQAKEKGITPTENAYRLCSEIIYG